MSTSKPTTARTGPGVTRAILGSGGLYAAATAAPIVSALFVTPIVTRLLGPEEYGVVGIGVSVYQMGLVLLALGLPASITRHAIVEKSGIGGAAGLVVTGMAAAVLLGALVIVLIPLWAPLLLDGWNPWILAAPVVSAVGLACVTLVQSLLRGIDRVLSFVVLGGLAALVPPILGVSAVAMVDTSAAVYLSALALGHILVAVAGAIMGLVGSKPAIRVADVRSALAIGTPTVPHQVATSLLATVLVVLAGQIGGIENAGRMQIALLLGTAPLVIIGAINNSWAPLVYRADENQRPGVLANSTRLVSALCLVLVAGFCTVAPMLVDLIAGPEISSPDQINAATIASGAAAFMVLYLCNVHLVFLSGKTGPLAWTTPTSFAIAVGGVWALSVYVPAADIRVLALALPLFHASQWGMSSWLRARAGFSAPRIGSSLPYLASALAISALTSMVPVHLPLRIAVLFLVVGSVGLVELRRGRNAANAS